MKSTAELIDELSGLYTRKAFNQEIEKRIREKIPFSLFLIDIDYFKAINDNFGHLRGDEVIRDFSEWLRSQVDTELVFRLGGDEFAIIYSPPERSREIAERIKKNIKKRIFYGDPPLHLSLSIGFSVFP
ncbi:diguanylate cyclase, partial [bacterium]